MKNKELLAAFKSAATSATYLREMDPYPEPSTMREIYEKDAEADRLELVILARMEKNYWYPALCTAVAITAFAIGRYWI